MESNHQLIEFHCKDSKLQLHFPNHFDSNGVLKRKIFLPVIHCTSQEQVESNVKLVIGSSADGCFLINHGFSYTVLLQYFKVIKEKYPNFWIGVNLLGITALKAFEIIPKDILHAINGLWADDAGIDEHQGANQQGYAQRVSKLIEKRGFSGLYFGGIAFKYKREVKDLETSARIARQWMDVVTTSGPGTGKPADIEKIKRIRYGLASKPLAIASGITIENVSEYLPYVDCYLVATGISSSFDQLDESKVKQLEEILHNQIVSSVEQEKE